MSVNWLINIHRRATKHAWKEKKVDNKKKTEYETSLSWDAFSRFDTLIGTAVRALHVRTHEMVKRGPWTERRDKNIDSPTREVYDGRETR
jgi:hypothetical protein